MSAPGPQGLRFAASAATVLRDAIRDVEWDEVFAIGDVSDGAVQALEINCRGQQGRVIALTSRPRAGQVVIHNHPSGDLRPSDPDMALAGRYGDNGVGFVIVDNEVSRSRWVVEPHSERQRPVDPTDVERVFHEALPRAIDGFEPRSAQLEMAHQVARSLSNVEPLAVEAGTGTGKSLAYLIPAALWALKNDGRVIVSTYTKALQSQLMRSDLPLLRRAGLEVRSAVLLGRNNYLCRRRLALARDDDGKTNAGGNDTSELDAVSRWADTTRVGTRLDLGVDVSPALWERVESDSDLTLRVRCPHYDTCHFYTARRRAAGAHIVVVNHALFMADRANRASGGPGVLPKYQRVILDEAHHLERAATGSIGGRLTLPGVQRALGPLLPTTKRPGALARLLLDHASNGGALPPEDRATLEGSVTEAVGALERVRETLPRVLETLASGALDADGTPRRIRHEDRGRPPWSDAIAPAAELAESLLSTAVGALASTLDPFADLAVPQSRVQSLLDVRRGQRRLAQRLAAVQTFLGDDRDVCRWISLTRTRGDVWASLDYAPIDVAEPLRRLLWDPVPGTVVTSATLTVAGRFDHWTRRCGLTDAQHGLHPSPFDHATQALLGLPRDLPPPNDPRFLQTSGDLITEAVQTTNGGAFVLCTSYAAVRAYARQLRERLPRSVPVLAQRGAGRAQILEQFRASGNAVLVGTDSFWEGVDVRGDALRLVIIPRLPFRVPTDPLLAARQERIAQRGGDPFRTFTLPEAVIKLRQGFGRLIRSGSDRGVVLLLDRRLHDRTYGRVLLHALPPARRVVGPWRRVREALDQFFH